MQDRPAAPELTETVSQFLLNELAPALSDPRLRFRTLIAANLMAIVGRELRDGDAAMRDEWRRLAALLGASAASPTDVATLRDQTAAMQRRLCAEIRAGTADSGPWAEAVMKYVNQSTIAKLAIANPRFLERLAAD